MSFTAEIQREHHELADGIDALREAGDLIGERPADVVIEHAQRALVFLRESLIPHARAEDEHLYPLVASLLGAPGATQTMSRDHIEVARLTSHLERALEASDLKAVRRLLYGLYHVVRLHFAKEEELYLPLLEQGLRKDQEEVLAHAMGTA